MAQIIRLSSKKLKDRGHIVINCILLETTYTAIKELERMKFENIEAVQVTIAKGRRVPQGTMMISRNPITIISAVRLGKQR